jgi:uncharacterized protein YciI
MPLFACRLNPPRPDFAATMSPEEAAAMQAHVGYWSGVVGQGKALLVGPVVDKTSIWGLAVVEVDDAEEAARMTAADPVITADLGLSYDILSIPQALLRDRST